MPRSSQQHKDELRIMARMPRLARSKFCSRAGSLAPRRRRSRLSPVGYLANPASLIGIPKLELEHAGNRIAFGCSDLTKLAQTLVEIDIADESDWIGAERVSAALVDKVFRRFLRDHGQETIAEHFELYLTLGESIVDTRYSDSGADSNGQLFLVLNTESSFPLGVGSATEELERLHPGMGASFYDTLRQALYRWIRVYDDYDAGNRIEQMVEWAEGEEDPDSYEIPKLDQDLPECLRSRESSESAPSLDSFPAPNERWLKELVETTLELHRVSHSMERPRLDEEWLEYQRSYHSLDLPLPAVLMYFCPGDAVMACFDDECEYWGQETPEPNLIIPLQPNDPASVRQALAVVETLMRVLLLTVRIKTLNEAGEKSTCDSASMSEANSN
jgi:hypothetical protein